MAKARASKPKPKAKTKTNAKTKPKASKAKPKAKSPKAKPKAKSNTKPSKPRAKKIALTPEEIAEAAALRAAILENPEDDAARLVYADWLTERGDPRGPFIVTGLEFARLHALDEEVGMDEATSRQHDALVDRLIKLDERYGQRFCDPVIIPYLAPNSYERGFVENVAMSVDAFVADGEAVLAAEPIRWVKIDVASEDELAVLATAPAIRKVPGLDFDYGRRLYLLGAAKPDLASLRRLNLMSSRGDNAAWREFFSQLAAPRLERLELLVIHGLIGLYDGIVKNPHLRGLRHLVVGQSFVYRTDDDEPPRTPESMTIDEAVCQLAALPLETLRFTHDDATLADATVATLFAETSAMKLKRAKLDGHTDAAAIAIAESPRAKELRRLDLTIPKLTGEGARALLEGLPALTYLGLSRDRKNDAFRDFTRLLLALPTSHPLRCVDASGLELDSDVKSALRERFILENAF